MVPIAPQPTLIWPSPTAHVRVDRRLTADRRALSGAVD
jgi:hypothetical protein